MKNRFLLEKKAQKKSKELGDNHSEKDLQKIDSELNGMKNGRVAQIWDKVLFLWDKAKSPDVPVRLKVTIIGALLYLILPADIVPDAIPGIGLIDDVGVLLAVYNELEKFFVPKVIEKAKVKLQESYYTKIDFKLKEIFYLMLLSSVITFVINMAGIAVLIVKPVGEYSRFIALGIFSITIIYTVIRIILYFKQYGKVTFGIVKLVIKEKSLSKGVSLFVQQTYPAITKIYAGINVAQKFVPGMDSIPDFDKIVKDFIKHFKKKVILVSSMFLLYSVTFFIIKLILSV
ncbi:MAG: DUF1232 domain-containing protein [Treponema sp.]|nr:DUF1232 domain-containing protein [Treponema sp.]